MNKPTTLMYLTKSTEQSASSVANSRSVKKFSAFYGTQRFNTMFTSARHWSLS